MQSFKEYRDAHNAAVDLANLLKRDVGILRAKEYTSNVFQVFGLPNPANRCGFELRCEVVAPNTPKSA